ncbi:MAG: hypothetical protein WKF36_09900 [Candidatus Nitrosocosmicus sp.]
MDMIALSTEFQINPSSNISPMEMIRLENGAAISGSPLSSNYYQTANAKLGVEVTT